MTSKNVHVNLILATYPSGKKSENYARYHGNSVKETRFDGIKSTGMEFSVKFLLPVIIKYVILNYQVIWILLNYPLEDKQAWTKKNVKGLVETFSLKEDSWFSFIPPLTKNNINALECLKLPTDQRDYLIIQ